MSDTPKQNPKEAAGGVKVPLHLCPDTVKIAGAMAFLEGATKYGAHNWRAAGIMASTYKSAMERHMISWWNGEDIDPDSGLPHLWKLLACVAVLIDASMLNKITDDRPPMSPLPELMKALEPAIAAIKAKNADKNPRHWSIADSEGMPKLPEAILGKKAGIPGAHEVNPGMWVADKSTSIFKQEK